MVQWEKVHVFISSTFSDMHAERDYLVKRVFPEVRAWCERRRLQLIDIDLRWGVPENDAVFGKNVVHACLKRIDECRPFFLCFLGQRRGWVPTPGDLPASKFRAYPEVSRYLGNASITELEITHAVLQPFAVTDTTDSSRVEASDRAFFYLREPSYLDELSRHNATLRRVYTNEAYPESRDRDDDALQQWRDHRIPSCGRPLRRYDAAFDVRLSTPELAMPLTCPATDAAAQRRWCKAWRDMGLALSDDVTAIDVATSLGQEAERINASLTTGRLCDFYCELDGAAVPTTPQATLRRVELADVVIADLKQAIAARYPQHVEQEATYAFAREEEQQQRFLMASTEGYVERPGDFDALDAYVASAERRPACLHGQGGIGKSTLLARWIQRLQARSNEGDGVDVLYRFIGGSAMSTDVDTLLTHLLEQLRHEGRLPDVSQSVGNPGLAFGEALSTLAHDRPVVLVFDGLDQLRTGTADLSWLPRTLPPRTKIVVSARDPLDKVRPALLKEATSEKRSFSDQIASTAREKSMSSPEARRTLPAGEFDSPRVVSEPFLYLEAKAFDELADRRQLIRNYTSLFLKELDERELAALAAAPGVENPLFLKIVLEELRTYGSPFGLLSQIQHAFGATPESAFEAVLHRLQSDPPYSRVRPEKFIPFMFGLLAFAREGLTIDELCEVMAQNYLDSADDDRPTADQDDLRETLHDAIVVYQHQLRPFLQWRDGRLDFFFDAFRRAAVERFTRTGSDRAFRYDRAEQWHELLGRFFAARAGWRFTADASWLEQRAATADRRACGELLHHAAFGRLWGLGVAVLTSPSFYHQLVGGDGHLTLIIRFRTFVRALMNDPVGAADLRVLCDRLPISETTRPLLDELWYDCDTDLISALQSLEESIAPDRDHDRALLFFAPIVKALDESPQRYDYWSPEEVKLLTRIVPKLLRTQNLKMSWRTANAFWALLPTGPARLLLDAAEDPQVHHLVRAEAARQLGAEDDATIIEPLRGLGRAAEFPLYEFARRSARRIALRTGGIAPGAVDDWTQPAALPKDMRPLIERLEELGATVDVRGLSDRRPLIVGVAEPSHDTLEMSWVTAHVVLTLLRTLPCRYICVEGSARDSSLHTIRNLASLETWQDVGMRFLFDRVVAAEEYLNLVTEYPLRILGIEYRDLYDQAASAKYHGNVGTRFVASIERATGMIDNTLRWLRDYPTDVVVMLTKVLPNFQVSRLLGLKSESMDDRMLEQTLPERVSALHPAASAVSYVRVDLSAWDFKRHPSLSTNPHLDHLLRNQFSLKDLDKSGESPTETKSPFSKSRLLPPIDWTHVEKGLATRQARAVRADEVNLEGRSVDGLYAWRGCFRRANLTEASLKDAMLAGAFLDEARGVSANLSGANLFEACLRQADFSAADFSRANLGSADLAGGRFVDARFVQACLNQARLDKANLSRADLRGADLRQAWLCGCDLRGANLHEAAFDGARVDVDTRWPAPLPWDDFQILDDRFDRMWLGCSSAEVREYHKAVLAAMDCRNGFPATAMRRLTAVTRSLRTINSRTFCMALNRIVRVLIVFEQYDAALQWARWADDLADPRDTANWKNTRSNLGCTLAMTNCRREALTVLLSVVKVDPDFSRPHYWLARLFATGTQADDPLQEELAWRSYLSCEGLNEADRDYATERVRALKGNP